MQRDTLLRKTKNMFLIGMATMAFLVGCEQEPDPKAVQNFAYSVQDEEDYALFANRVLRYHTTDLIRAVESRFNKPEGKRASIQTGMKAWLAAYPEEEGTIPMPADSVRKQAFINRFVAEYSVGSASFDPTIRQNALQSWKRAMHEAHHEVINRAEAIFVPNFYYDGPMLPRTIQKQKTNAADWTHTHSYQNG